MLHKLTLACLKCATQINICLLNPLPTSPVAATGLCKDAADRASRQRGLNTDLDGLIGHPSPTSTSGIFYIHLPMFANATAILPHVFTSLMT